MLPAYHNVLLDVFSFLLNIPIPIPAELPKLHDAAQII